MKLLKKNKIKNNLNTELKEMGVFSAVAGNQLPNQLQTDVNQSLKTKSYFYFLTQPVCIVYRFCARVCPSSWFVSPVDTQIINTVSTARTPLAFSFSFPLFFFSSISSLFRLRFVVLRAVFPFSSFFRFVFRLNPFYFRFPAILEADSVILLFRLHATAAKRPLRAWSMRIPLISCLIYCVVDVDLPLFFSCLAYLFRFLFGHRLFFILSFPVGTRLLPRFCFRFLLWLV